MPIHPLDKDWRPCLAEDREACQLAGELGFAEGYVGEHATDKAKNITSCAMFIAWIGEQAKRMRLGTGTVNMPNTPIPSRSLRRSPVPRLLNGCVQPFRIGCSKSPLFKRSGDHTRKRVCASW